MEKKYISKIIANDNEGLQMISACCEGAEIMVNDIKYLKKNKIFLLSLMRNKIEELHRKIEILQTENQSLIIKSTESKKNE